MIYNEEMKLGYLGVLNPIAQPLKYRALSVAQCSRRKHQRWAQWSVTAAGPKWKAEAEEGIQAALDSKDEAEVTQEEKRVLWVWGAEAPQQPESSKSLPHGSIENSSLADSFCLIVAPEAEGGSPPRKQHAQKPFLCMNLFLGVTTYIHVHACTCGCQRLRWWPSSVSFYFLLWASLNLEIVNSTGLAGQEVLGFLLSLPPQQWDCVCTAVPGLSSAGSGDLNSGPLTCTASTFPPEPSSGPGILKGAVLMSLPCSNFHGNISTTWI